MAKHRKGYQPVGLESFAKCCPICFNQGSELCFKCKMEVESGFDPMDDVTQINTRTYTMYGGQRGGGKIFFLETLVSFLRKELEEIKQDRDRWKSAALYYKGKANAKNKWIHTSEALPTEADADSHECVLVHTDNNENLIVHYDAVRNCREFIHFWMPLSDTPKED